jgi:hypothetical protein
MKRWALINLANVGEVRTTVEQETKPTVFVEEDKSDWVEITDTPYVSSGYKYNIQTKTFDLIKSDTILTRAELMNQLGDDYVEVVAASKTDAAVEVWLEKFRMTDTFNLNEQKVKDSINFLVNKNILSREAADKLLSL